MNKPEYYRDATKWLDDNFPFFLTNVVNIGNPIGVATVPRAAVSLRDVNDFSGDFELQLNEDYCSGLPADQLAGVLCHEAMHILLRHLQDIPLYENKRALVLAQECIVNDKLTREGIPLPTDLYFGIETLGVDTADMTTPEAYELALQKLSEEGEDDMSGEGMGGIFEEFFGMAGQALDSLLGDIIEQGMADGTVDSISQELLDDLIDALGGDSSPAAIPTEVQEALDSLKSVDLPTNSKQAGTGFNSVESLAQDLGSSIAWMKLLADICPDILNKKGRMPSRERPSWHRPRRALTSLYPDVLLPVGIRRGEKDARNEDGDRTPHLILALDFSGSIDRSNLELMKSLALSVPDDIKVDCCTFSTQHIPYYYKNAKNRTASGGTDFSAIEKFVRSVQGDQKKYPSAVVVITDGEASFNSVRPTDEQAKNWLWLALSESDRRTLTNGYYGTKAPAEQVKLLRDYIEKGSRKS